MNDKSRTYAKIAQAAYSPTAPQEIDGYQLVLNYTNDRVKVYKINGELVFSVRGTDVRNIGDLVADVNIFYNRLSKDRVYNDIKNQLEFLLSQKILRRMTLVGHSLGGAICTELLLEFPDRIDAVYTFNSGIGYHRFISNLKDRLSCLLDPSTRDCVELDIIKKKLHVYITGSDPISLLNISTHGNINFIKPNSPNVHSISNFVGGLLMDIHQVIRDLRN
jgi:hypothetical protein